MNNKPENRPAARVYDFGARPHDCCCVIRAPRELDEAGLRAQVAPLVPGHAIENVLVLQAAEEGEECWRAKVTMFTRTAAEALRAAVNAAAAAAAATAPSGAEGGSQLVAFPYRRGTHLMGAAGRTVMRTRKCLQLLNELLPLQWSSSIVALDTHVVEPRAGDEAAEAVAGPQLARRFSRESATAAHNARMATLPQAVPSEDGFYSATDAGYFFMGTTTLMLPPTCLDERTFKSSSKATAAPHGYSTDTPMTTDTSAAANNDTSQSGQKRKRQETSMDVDVTFGSTASGPAADLDEATFAYFPAYVSLPDLKPLGRTGVRSSFRKEVRKKWPIFVARAAPAATSGGAPGAARVTTSAAPNQPARIDLCYNAEVNVVLHPTGASAGRLTVCGHSCRSDAPCACGASNLAEERSCSSTADNGVDVLLAAFEAKKPALLPVQPPEEARPPVVFVGPALALPTRQEERLAPAEFIAGKHLKLSLSWALRDALRGVRITSVPTV